MNPVLRSAQSTPYIRSPTDFPEKENSNECLAVGRNNPNANGVQFNAGSSSSLNLSQLIEIYNDIGETADFEEWLKVYKKQRPQDDKNSESQSIGFEGYSSDSCGNLITPKSCSTQSICDQASNYSNMHRSMDVLPTIKEGFYALEKCVSVEFPTKILIPPSKLCRSKEMPNLNEEL